MIKSFMLCSNMLSTIHWYSLQGLENYFSSYLEMLFVHAKLHFKYFVSNGNMQLSWLEKKCVFLINKQFLSRTLVWSSEKSTCLQQILYNFNCQYAVLAFVVKNIVQIRINCPALTNSLGQASF